MLVLLPAALIVPQISEPRIGARLDHGFDFRASRIRARIVDHDQFRQHLGGHVLVGLRNEMADISGLVECRNDNGDAHVGPCFARKARELVSEGAPVAAPWLKNRPPAALSVFHENTTSLPVAAST
jgi:hypothetical protein